MTDDFFAVLATDEIIVFDFRKRSKEQQEQDAEELKKMQEEFTQIVEQVRYNNNRGECVC